ncbi:protein-tyrosine phosphatase family protein [Streptomyces armeniacus]
MLPTPIRLWGGCGSVTKKRKRKAPAGSRRPAPGPPPAPVSALVPVSVPKSALPPPGSGPPAPADRETSPEGGARVGVYGASVRHPARAPRGYARRMTASPASSWEPAAAGVLRLPSGRLVRGRGLRRPLPPGAVPDFALYLLGRQPPAVDWESRWVRWPDFRLPADREAAADALREAWERAVTERVEVACGAGVGRTGTALACLAVLDGVPNAEAVAYVREHYAPRAVETPWQRRYVSRFSPAAQRRA